MKKIFQNNLLIDRDSENLHELFHANSKLDRFGARRFGQQVAVFGAVPQIVKETRKPGKVYSFAGRVMLPFDALGTISEANLLDALLSRTSRVADAGQQAVTIGSISCLLAASAGANSATVDHLGPLKRRMYPSAGALYPLEVYLIINKVHGLERGIYHYLPNTHELEELAHLEENLSDALSCFAGVEDEEISAAVILTAVFHRNTLKYGDRGYRMVLLEAGHLAQNIALVSAAIKVPCLPIGGANDERLEALMELDGVEESVVYPLVLGSQ